MRSGILEYDAIVTVARLGGFRAAAAELNMSPSALSNAVAALETKLKVRLFNRTTRSVSLTDAGDQFIARIAPALLEIGGAIEAINSHRHTPSGHLRINTSAGAARMIMTPIIFKYLERYPDMTVTIVTEGKLIDVVGQGFDAGIRIAEAVPQDMIAIPIGGQLRGVVVGAPAYFEHHPRPVAPSRSRVLHDLAWTPGSLLQSTWLRENQCETTSKQKKRKRKKRRKSRKRKDHP